MKRKQPKTIEMKKNKIFKPAFIFIKLSAIIALIIVSQSCNSDKKLKKGEHLESKKDDVIEIVTELMDFQTQDTIPSGWNTFKYMNNSAETHFFLLDKYPEGKSIEDAKKEVGPPFQAGMDLINEGKVEEGYEQFNKLPAWFFEVIYFGGSGLVSSNNSSLTTIKLEAGYYIMECYVKMANGKFHSSMGMEKVIIVTNNDSGKLPPKSSIDINISSTEGITYNKLITKGFHTFSVNFIDQIAHENFVGHDVNLVKYDENFDLKILESWMNWVNPKGLISPSPGGVTFLGGVNDMSAGSTGYFSVDLGPGNYAFISEVPNTSSKNMLKTFVVLD